MTARILDCTPAEYFADPCHVPSLNQSIARTLVTKSPAHAWTEHPRFGGRRRDPTEQMTNGSLVHEVLLQGSENLVLVAADDWRTKDARAQRDEAIVAGKTPILERKFAEVSRAAEEIKLALAGFGVGFVGRSEVPIEWHETDSGTGAPVVCRGMLDHFEMGAIATVYDLKTTESASPSSCERSAYNFGYDIQAAAYTSAVEKLHPEMAGLVEFVFLFAETTPPYAVYPCRPDGTLRELGERRWQRAVDLWAKCLAANVWPGYADKVGVLSAPTWALSQEEGLL